MANCLRVPMTSSPCLSSSSTLRSPRKRNFSVMNKFRLPSRHNPNDPFLQGLASAAANNPEKIFDRQKDADTLPFMDIFETPSPRNDVMPAKVDRSKSNGRRPRSGPPDLASLMLDGRVVLIGMPLVPLVTELIIAELLYLMDMDPDAPVHLYINSTGCTRADYEPIARESEGFAIYDFITQNNIKVHTLCMGYALGQACLLLASGIKGKRFMLPHSVASIFQPKITPSGLMPACDVMTRAREARIARDTFVYLMAEHTGNSMEVVANAMKTRFTMNAESAKRFGVIDKIYSKNNVILPNYRDAGEFNRLRGLDASA